MKTLTECITEIESKLRPDFITEVIQEAGIEAYQEVLIDLAKLNMTWVNTPMAKDRLEKVEE